MTQLNRTKSRIVIAGLLAGVALASLPAFAQTSAQTSGTDQGNSMMQHGMPNGGAMKPGMMSDREMQQKMSRMVDNCNRMMDGMMQNKDISTTPSNPTNKG